MKINSALARGCVLSVCALTSACGGGGGGTSGGVVSTPPPPPSYARLDYPTTNLNLKMVTTAVRYTDKDGERVDVKREVLRDFGTGSIIINYDASNQTYTVSDLGIPNTYKQFTYGESDRISPKTDKNKSDQYDHRKDQNNIDLLWVIKGSGDRAFIYSAIIYTGIQNYSLDPVEGWTVNTRASTSVGGIETLSSDMPKTGTAEYFNTIMTGSFFDISNSVTGTARISADFSKGSVSTTLSMNDALSKPLGTFSGTTPIDQTGTHFKGDLTADGAVKGTFSGGFFGPQAAEVGYIFRVGTSAGVVDGAVLGRKN